MGFHISIKISFLSIDTPHAVGSHWWSPPPSRGCRVTGDPGTFGLAAACIAGASERDNGGKKRWENMRSCWFLMDVMVLEWITWYYLLPGICYLLPGICFFFNGWADFFAGWTGVKLVFDVLMDIGFQSDRNLISKTPPTKKKKTSRLAICVCAFFELFWGLSLKCNFTQGFMRIYLKVGDHKETCLCHPLSSFFLIQAANFFWDPIPTQRNAQPTESGTTFGSCGNGMAGSRIQTHQVSLGKATPKDWLIHWLDHVRTIYPLVNSHSYGKLPLW